MILLRLFLRQAGDKWDAALALCMRPSLPNRDGDGQTYLGILKMLRYNRALVLGDNTTPFPAQSSLLFGT